MEKKKINFQGLVAAVGVNLLLPTAALVLSLLFSMISYPVFVFFRVVQFVIWAVTAFMLVYKVYNIKSGIIQLLVLLGCSVVSYYVISALANWLVSSLSSYGIFEILSSIF